MISSLGRAACLLGSRTYQLIDRSQRNPDVREVGELDPYLLNRYLPCSLGKCQCVIIPGLKRRRVTSQLFGVDCFGRFRATILSVPTGLKIARVLEEDIPCPFRSRRS